MTVGGSTKGSVKMPSRTIFSLSCFNRTTSLAQAIPRKKVITMDKDAVFKDIRIGEKSIRTAPYLLAEKPYSSKTAIASSDCRNSMKSFASSECSEAATIPTG